MGRNTRVSISFTASSKRAQKILTADDAERYLTEVSRHIVGMAGYSIARELSPQRTSRGYLRYTCVLERPNGSNAYHNRKIGGPQAIISLTRDGLGVHLIAIGSRPHDIWREISFYLASSFCYPGENVEYRIASSPNRHPVSSPLPNGDRTLITSSRPAASSSPARKGTGR